MLYTDDVAVDRTDDFVIFNGDIMEEPISARNTLQNARRRVSARFDDFVLIPEISAAIETFLQRYITDITLSDIEQNIRYALNGSSLFENKDMDIYFNTSNQDKLGVVIKFNIPGISSSVSDEELTFSTFVDIQNQRSFV